MHRKKLKRTTLIAFRAEVDFLDEVETFIESGRFDNVSKAIRETSKVGMRVLHYQDMMKDPEKAAEFQKKMQDVIQSGEAVDWVKTLDMEQLRGFIDLMQLEREGRMQVKHLI